MSNSEEDISRNDLIDDKNSNTDNKEPTSSFNESLNDDVLNAQLEAEKSICKSIEGIKKLIHQN